MAFIYDKKEQVKTKIRNFNDSYKDAMNKGISIVPFDIYKYVNSFDDIEIINNDDKLFPFIGLIEKYQDGFVIAISKNLELKLQLSNLREYSNELNNLANELQKAIELNSPIQIKTIAKKLISHIKGE